MRLRGESGRLPSSWESSVSCARRNAPTKCCSISPAMEPSRGLIWEDPNCWDSREWGTRRVAKGERVSEELLKLVRLEAPSLRVRSTDGACTLGNMEAPSCTIWRRLHLSIWPGVRDPEQSESSANDIREERCSCLCYRKWPPSFLARRAYSSFSSI